MALSMTDLMVTTLDRYSNKLYDNVLESNFLLSRLAKKGKVKLLPGGAKIEEDLMYAENETFKWYKGYEQLDTRANPVITAATYEWKMANANILISGEDRRKNADSETRKYNLIESRIKVCETTMKNQISKALFSNRATVDLTGGRMIEGLQILISDAPGTKGDTVGTISAVENTWWRNYATPLKSADAVAGDKLLAAMESMFMDCTRGEDAPTMIIMDKNYYTTYKTKLTSLKRFLDIDKADGSFRFLEFNGVPVYFDKNCPENHAYFINDNYLFFKVHEDANFKLDKERMPHNQDAYLFPMIFMGNLTCSNRALQGVIFTSDSK